MRRNRRDTVPCGISVEELQNLSSEARPDHLSESADPPGDCESGLSLEAAQAFLSATMTEAELLATGAYVPGELVEASTQKEAAALRLVAALRGIRPEEELSEEASAGLRSVIGAAVQLNARTGRVLRILLAAISEAAAHATGAPPHTYGRGGRSVGHDLQTGVALRGWG